MSRSFKKNPYVGILGGSEKQDKRNFNKGFRTETRSLINKEDYDNLPERKNPLHGRNWNFRKDGKTRFDKKKHPELMRR